MSEWITRPLSELAEIRVSNVDKKTVAGEKPVRLCNYMDAYSNDYIRSDIAFMEATASPAEIARFAVTLGDVVLTKDSETPDDIGIPAVVTDQIENLVCGYHLALLKTKQELVDPVFLCKQLATPRAANYFGKRATGSTRYGLANRTLANLPVPVPPLATQRAISRVLQTIDTAIERTEALIAKHQQIKAGLMHDLFTRGVLPNGQLRPPRNEAPELYQETAIGWVPKDWEVSKLHDLLAPLPNNIRSGPFGSALLKHELVEDGIPFLGIDNIYVERFEPTFRRFVSERKFQELAKYRVRPKDVVITIMGTVGRCCVIPDDVETALSSKHLWTMTFDPAKVIPELICWQLNHSTWALTWFRRAMQGGIMEAIQSSTLKTLMLPVPDMAEQHLIFARYLGAVERIQLEEQQLEKLQKQKFGLMQDLLTGKVAVSAPPERTEAAA